MRRRIRHLSVLLAVLAALGLVACGDDEEAADTGGGTGDAVAEESTETAEPAADPTDTSKKPVIERPTGTPPRKLEVENIVKGKGRGAKRGDVVIVHYVGVNFSNGEEFDASWDVGQPIPVQLGGGQVIPGWEKGLLGIKNGGRRKLTVPPELAYGPQGYPPDIGPNETLVFVVDALDVQAPPAGG